MTTQINLSEFTSPFDAQHAGQTYQKERYGKGQKLAQQGWKHLSISETGCWSASGHADGGVMPAYEVGAGRG